ncbi:MAG: ubiquinol-cytochrome c reductase iron-sulfur subunit [Betaproteobacteria bacterium]|nr:ubiquinol-cytochrome c reductase iron-sulfur subunit [Betaproteobacteria bacterium]MDH3435568.1 ubiquinol-cytochrome c reductase iron-sulfur subunit [Betaproteobacteria bacterium]
MADKELDSGKRRFLIAATSVAGGVAAGATAVPFVASMLPSERAKAAGAPVEADITNLAPGELMRLEWRGKPVWIVRRTKEMLESVRKNDTNVADPESQRNPDYTPPYARNEYRSIKPEYLVVVGICTHLGCSPVDKFKAEAEPFDANWKGGFYCPCHGSLFDLAGRVYKNKPAPDNLPVPPHTYLSDSTIRIGEDQKGA